MNAQTIAYLWEAVTAVFLSYAAASIAAPLWRTASQTDLRDHIGKDAQDGSHPHAQAYLLASSTTGHYCPEHCSQHCDCDLCDPGPSNEDLDYWAREAEDREYKARWA